MGWCGNLPHLCMHLTSQICKRKLDDELFRGVIFIFKHWMTHPIIFEDCCPLVKITFLRSLQRSSSVSRICMCMLSIFQSSIISSGASRWRRSGVSKFSEFTFLFQLGKNWYFFGKWEMKMLGLHSNFPKLFLGHLHIFGKK